MRAEPGDRRRGPGAARCCLSRAERARSTTPRGHAASLPSVVVSPERAGNRVGSCRWPSLYSGCLAMSIHVGVTPFGALIEVVEDPIAVLEREVNALGLDVEGSLTAVTALPDEASSSTIASPYSSKPRAGLVTEPRRRRSPACPGPARRCGPRRRIERDPHAIAVRGRHPSSDSRTTASGALTSFSPRSVTARTGRRRPVTPRIPGPSSPADVPPPPVRARGAAPRERGRGARCE
jgi:hypothetical protein